MIDPLKESWGSFSDDIASKYLKSFGHPSEESKQLLFEILKELGPAPMKLVDLGCGNANLAEFLISKRLEFAYTGVDFSDVLLSAAKLAVPSAELICDDVNILNAVPPGFDIAVYSHVIEMLPSPENSLLAASRIAKKIVIRFFDPPADRADWVELLQMNIGGAETVPYIRRKMSQDYYRLILAKINCIKVDVYRTGGKDQVHVLHF